MTFFSKIKAQKRKIWKLFVLTRIFNVDKGKGEMKGRERKKYKVDKFN